MNTHHSCIKCVVNMSMQNEQTVQLQNGSDKIEICPYDFQR